MPTIKLHITNWGFDRYTLALMKMGKSRLPSAVRNTLSRAAMDVKKVTMPDSSNRFVHRNLTFFKSQSRVEFAKGYDIDSMVASVGFVSKNNKRAHSVEDLVEQEYGGAIADRSYMPTDEARVGNDYKRQVKGKLRFKNIESHGKPKYKVAADNPRYGDTRQGFLASAIAAGKGGLVMGNDRTFKGARLIYQVNSLKRVDGNTKLKLTAIYTYKQGRTAKIVPTEFMKEASLITRDKLLTIYGEEAVKQLNRK